jgi:hypothetical protein
MDNTLIIALISLAGSLILASLTYWFTKRGEIRKEWRKDKINHYQELLAALSDLAVDGTNKDDANMKFARAVNTICLVAPQNVVTALMNFHDGVKFSNQNRNPEDHDRLLKRLLLEIRKDIKIPISDNEKTFEFHLIGSRPQE